MEVVFVILAVFSVPLAAIVSSAWLKYKKLELDARGAGSPALERRLMALEGENAELKQRVETLETIATGTARELEAAPRLKELEAPKR